MADSSILAAAAVTVTCLIFSLKERSEAKKRRHKGREQYRKRQRTEEVCDSISRELLISEQDGYKKFKRYLPINEDCFYELLRRVEPHIKRKDTVMKEAISAEKRLVVALRYLASGKYNGHL